RGRRACRAGAPPAAPPARVSRRGENLGTGERRRADPRAPSGLIATARAPALTHVLSVSPAPRRTHSMSVDLEEGLFFCFACGAKGGVKAFRKLVWETQPTPRPAAPRPPQSEWAETWRSAVELKGRERAQHQALAPLTLAPARIRWSPTARQARRSDTWYASRGQCTRARRTAGLTIFFLAPRAGSSCLMTGLRPCP